MSAPQRKNARKKIAAAKARKPYSRPAPTPAPNPPPTLAPTRSSSSTPALQPIGTVLIQHGRAVLHIGSVQVHDMGHIRITPEEKESDLQNHLESLQPDVLASDLEHWASIFKGMSQMLKTDTGKQDSFLHHTTRWYVDQIEALDKLPVLAQTVQQWREDAFGNHLHGSEDDGDEEKEHNDGHGSIMDHCAKCLAKEIS